MLYKRARVAKTLEQSIDYGILKSKERIMFTIAITLTLLLVAGAVTSAGATVDLRVFVTGGTGNLVHELDMKATEGANGQVIPMSGFTIEPSSVIQIHQSGILHVFTSTNGPGVIDSVKVTMPTGQLVELVQIGTGWSLQGLANGVYLLDVIVNIPNGSKGAYETVLVILAPNEPSKNTAQVIKQVVKVDTRIVFQPVKDKLDIRKICSLNPDDKRCPKPDPETGDCPKGWSQNEAGQCFPSGPCDEGYTRADDDESGRCIPFQDLHQCEDGGWRHKNDTCPEDEEPICEPGFVDLGNGCEPIREPSPGCECPVGMDCPDVFCPDPGATDEEEAAEEDTEDTPDGNEEAEEETDEPIEDEEDNGDASESTETGNAENDEIPSFG